MLEIFHALSNNNNHKYLLTKHEPFALTTLQKRKREAAVPGVPPQRCVMESVEAVVVSDGDVSAGLQQNRQHVVPLLADGVVERCVSFRVLQIAQGSSHEHVHEPVFMLMLVAVRRL